MWSLNTRNTHADGYKPLPEEESVENSRTMWVLTLTLMAPMFAISTHMGFILVAWLTDMSQASSVVLIYLAALLYPSCSGNATVLTAR